MTTPPSKILLILIVIIFAAIGYFYYSNLAVGPESPPVVPFSEAKTSIDSLANLNVDFSILDTGLFKSLRQYGESPVDKGNVGRKNIFAP